MEYKCVIQLGMVLGRALINIRTDLLTSVATLDRGCLHGTVVQSLIHGRGGGDQPLDGARLIDSSGPDLEEGCPANA